MLLLEKISYQRPFWSQFLIIFFLKKQKTVLALTQPTQLEQNVAILPTNRLGAASPEIHSPPILPFDFLPLLWERKRFLKVCHITAT